TSTPLTLGGLANGSLATPGEQDRYTFTLPGAALLYFDAQTNNFNLTWTLTGPAGTAVSNRPFAGGIFDGDPAVGVPAGDYALAIDLPGDQTGAYAFRLRDLSAATPLTPGTPVSGSLDPANETDLYQFTAAAGDRFFFDLQARSNGGSSRW